MARRAHNRDPRPYCATSHANRDVAPSKGVARFPSSVKHALGTTGRTRVRASDSGAPPMSDASNAVRREGRV